MDSLKHQVVGAVAVAVGLLLPIPSGAQSVPSASATQPGPTVQSPVQTEPAAQATPPPPPPAAPATPPVPETPPPAAQPTPPTPPAPPAPSRPPVRPYGTLRAVGIVHNGVESFGNLNASAITAAANPAILNAADADYLSFVAQQSRFGLLVGEGSPVRGTLEADFIQFNLANPTTASLLRLRIAQVDWTFVRGHKVFIGQGWDTFSPLNTHTTNIVGNLFQAGNSGFFRNQLGWAGTFGPVELQVAAGMPGTNNGPTLGDLEYGAVPTAAMRLGFRLNPATYFGLSGIFGSLRFTSGTQHERTNAFGGNAFADLTFGVVNLRAEAYIAQNLASTGALTLGAGRFGYDVRDAGGWLSLRVNLQPHSLHVVGGAAAVLNRDDLAVGYTLPTTMGASPVRTLATGPGIEWNAAFRVGYSVSPFQGFSLFVEPFVYVTRHKLDATSTLDPIRIAYGTEAGGMFTF